MEKSDDSKGPTEENLATTLAETVQHAQDDGGGVYPKQNCPHIFALSIDDCISGLSVSLNAKCRCFIIYISSTVRLFHNNLYYKTASVLLLLSNGCAFIVKPQNALDTFELIWRSIGCRLLGRLVNILWPFHGPISRSGVIAVVSM